MKRKHGAQFVFYATSLDLRLLVAFLCAKCDEHPCGTDVLKQIHELVIGTFRFQRPDHCLRHARKQQIALAG
jgi:hypothetical protein